MEKQNKHVETVGEYADKHLWTRIHQMRAPKPVNTRVIDVTGIDDQGWDALLGRLKTVE